MLYFLWLASSVCRCQGEHGVIWELEGAFDVLVGDDELAEVEKGVDLVQMVEIVQESSWAGMGSLVEIVEDGFFLGSFGALYAHLTLFLSRNLNPGCGLRQLFV